MLSTKHSVTKRNLLSDYQQIADDETDAQQRKKYDSITPRGSTSFLLDPVHYCVTRSWLILGIVLVHVTILLYGYSIAGIRIFFTNASQIYIRFILLWTSFIYFLLVWDFVWITVSMKDVVEAINDVVEERKFKPLINVIATKGVNRSSWILTTVSWCVILSSILSGIGAIQSIYAYKNVWSRRIDSIARREVTQLNIFDTTAKKRCMCYSSVLEEISGIIAQECWANGEVLVAEQIETVFADHDAFQRNSQFVKITIDEETKKSIRIKVDPLYNLNEMRMRIVYNCRHGIAFPTKSELYLSFAYKNDVVIAAPGMRRRMLFDVFGNYSFIED